MTDRMALTLETMRAEIGTRGEAYFHAATKAFDRIGISVGATLVDRTVSFDRHDGSIEIVCIARSRTAHEYIWTERLTDDA